MIKITPSDIDTDLLFAHPLIAGIPNLDSGLIALTKAVVITCQLNGSWEPVRIGDLHSRYEAYFGTAEHKPLWEVLSTLPLYLYWFRFEGNTPNLTDSYDALLQISDRFIRTCFASSAIPKLDRSIG